MICQILNAVADQMFLGDKFIKCDGGNLYDHTLYRSMIRLAYGSDIRKIDDYYKFIWFEDEEDWDDALEQFSRLVTDSVFTCPNYDMAMAVSPTNTYFYRYAVDAICSVASESEDCVGFSCHGDEIATVFGSYGVPAVAEIGDCTSEKFDSLQPYVETVQKQWGHFIREGTPDLAATEWRVVSDEKGPVFRVEQNYTVNGRIPMAGESIFTTHHTEQESHTAQEVCKTWAEHTYKSESGAAWQGKELGKFAVVISSFVVLLSWF
jgi:hypothetical protein